MMIAINSFYSSGTNRDADDLFDRFDRESTPRDNSNRSLALWLANRLAPAYDPESSAKVDDRLRQLEDDRA